MTADSAGEQVAGASGDDKVISARSVNKRIKALRQFGRWLEDTGRIPKSPFRRLPLRNEETDKHLVRTVFSPAQWKAFVKAVRRRPLLDAERIRVNKGVTPEQRKKLRRLGQVRALACCLGHGVGLRRNEILTGTRGDYDLERGLLRVQARNAKARREDIVPIDAKILRLLRAYVRTKPNFHPHDRLFADERGRTLVPNAGTFRRDLEFAGIDRENGQGEVLDFHALRTTFITNQADKGTPAHQLKALARHAKIETTLKYYARVNMESLRREVERALPERAEAQVKTPAPATGQRAEGH